MNAYDSLRQVLEAKAVQIATGAGVKVLLPNEQGSPPTDGSLWAETWHRTGKTKPSLGGGRKSFKCAAGLWQFTLYCPEKTGNGPITRAADIIRAAIDLQQYSIAPDGYMTLDTAQVDQMPKTYGGNYAVLVHATFDFHYRDPDAADWQPIN